MSEKRTIDMTREEEIKANPCEHKWAHLSTHYACESNNYAVTYTRVDVFFCELCCETKDVKRGGTEYSGDPEPIWWRH